jgi:hypothetical protein
MTNTSMSSLSKFVKTTLFLMCLATIFAENGIYAHPGTSPAVIRTLRKAMLPEAQQGDKLCWAACTHMIMKFWRDADPISNKCCHSQHQLANENDPSAGSPPACNTDCPSADCTVPQAVNRMSVPFNAFNSELPLSAYGYQFFDVIGCLSDIISSPALAGNPALPSIPSQLENNGPFIAKVEFADKTIHFVVVSDYLLDTDNNLYLNILNPLPVSTLGCQNGTTMVVPYKAFSQSSFRIFPNGPTGEGQPTVKHDADYFHFQ